MVLEADAPRERWRADFYKGYLLRRLHLLHRIRCISKRWETVIRDCPPFWAVVHDRWPQSAWETMLARSQTTPLQVSWDLRPQRDLLKRKHATAYRREILRHTERWQSVVLTDPADDVIAVLKKSKLAALTSLWVTCSLGRSRQMLLERENAPELRDIYLSGVWFDWSSSLFSSLRSLSLQLSTKGLSLQRAVDILRNCPQLHELWLATITFTDIELTGKQLPIPLPQLTSLGLVYIPDNTACLLMDLLEVRKCQIFKLHVTKATDTPTFGPYQHSPSSQRDRKPPEAIACTKLMMPSFVHFVSLSQRLRIHLEYHTFIPGPLISLGSGGYDDGRSFSEDTWNAHFTNMSTQAVLIDWLPSTLKTFPSLNTLSVEITFSQSFGDVSWEDQLALLSHLPRLTSMTFNTYFNGMDGVLQALGGPVEGDDGTMRWLCPALHTLRFDDCPRGPLSLLERLVLARNGISTVTAEGGEQLEKPVPLRAVEISGFSPLDMEPEAFDRIKAVVGEGSKWDPVFSEYDDDSYERPEELPGLPE